METSGDTGIVLTEHARRIALDFAVAVGTFMVVFIGVMCRMTNEIFVARRCIWWVRVAAVLSFAGYLANLYFEARILRRVLWPHLGLVFPILGILLSGLALFVNSHPAFRWLVFLLQPLCVTMNTLETANLDIVITCRANKTCETADGWSDDELDRVYWSRMALIFLSVWMVLISGYLAASLGVCRPRYPVRLFSTSHPMSELPSTATQYGRLAAANVVKPADAKRWTTDGNGGRSPNRSPSPAGGATRRKDDANRSRRNEP